MSEIKLTHGPDQCCECVPHLESHLSTAKTEIETWKAKFVLQRCADLTDGYDDGKKEMEAENKRLREALGEMVCSCKFNDDESVHFTD